jgi:hypothetical protein
VREAGCAITGVALDRSRYDPPTVSASATTRPGDRGVLLWTLIALSCIAVVLATLAVGVQQLTLNTDRWVATVGPLASDPTVQSSVANAAAGQVVSALDVQRRVESLPRPLQRLAAPAESTLDTFVHEQALNVAQSTQFASLWTNVNRTGHPALVQVLRGETPSAALLRVSNGELQLNLLALLPGLAERLQQLPANPLAAARADLGYVSIASAGQLATAQQVVQLLDRTSLLLIAAVGLILATLIVSPDRRWTTLRLGLGIAIGMLLAGVGLLVARGSLAASVADRPIGGVVEVALSAVVLSLAQLIVVVFIVAAVVALVAFVLGRSIRASVSA